MAFTDVIDNYANGAAGTLTTVSGDTVGYTVTSTASTATFPNTDQGARITGDGSATVTVNFDETVTGLSISFDRSNSPEEYFVQIDGVTVNLATLIADGDATFTTTGAGTHLIGPNGGVTSSGSPTNGSLGFLTLNLPVNSVTVFGAGGTSGNFDIIEIGTDSVAFQIVCFAADTRIATPKGHIRAGDIQSGDTLLSADADTVVVAQVGQQHISPLQAARERRLQPIVIRAGALGHGLPKRDLKVSRQHRLLVASRIAQRLAGASEVLIPAHHLIGLDGIAPDPTPGPMTYIHIDVGTHALLLAEGAPAESLLHGDQTAGVISSPLDPATPVRPIPDAKTCKKIVAAHQRHQRSVLEDRGELLTS